ncbi:protein of unknown function [Methylocaldum szegediense]|uniref:Uncharacterized protein n=1 Tax=Methylocaldum szegediense TaxID=73780 RepID=A0ABN8X6U7_9GAMM|nr:protein of unknown function [Methylocaldum szegediense]
MHGRILMRTIEVQVPYGLSRLA